MSGSILNLKILLIVLITLLAIVSVEANQQIVDANDPRLGPSEVLRVDEVTCGQWLPFRIQPTISPAVYQHSVKVSPYNTNQAMNVLKGLEQPRRMILVRGGFGRIVIDAGNGLIQGLRPQVLEESYQGSYLREYTADWNPSGDIKISSRSAQRIVLKWSGAGSTRIFTVYSDGRIVSSWKNGPRNLTVFTGCHPYNYMSTNGKTAVRFSQLTDRKRSLPGKSTFAFFGYRDASLELRTKGLVSASEEIWLDPGEIGWVWARDYLKDHPEVHPLYTGEGRKGVHEYFWDYMARNGALTYLAGGAIRKVVFTAGSGDFSVNYRIGSRGKLVLADILKPFSLKTATHKMSPPNVKVMDSSLETTRIWPNNFNGWELRPLKVAQINPLPCYFKIVLKNASQKERLYKLDIIRPAWMESAVVESDPVEWSINEPVVLPVKVPKYTEQAFWKTTSPVIKVAANSTKEIILRVKPVEETFGNYNFMLKWQTTDTKGNLPLSVKVIPNVLFQGCTMYSPLGMSPQDFRHFGTVSAWLYHPQYLRSYYSQIPLALQDQFLELQCKENMRQGAYTMSLGFVREYIQYAKQRSTGTTEGSPYFLQSPEQFIANSRTDNFLRKSLTPYRSRVYIADELWEVLDGAKGGAGVSVDEVGKWLGELIAGSPNPCYQSFMQQDIDNNYQVRLPHDIAELFYYCGRDESVHEYMAKLVGPKTKLFEEWTRKPELMAKAGTTKPRMLTAFWISGQLHVIDYISIRRQHWYGRFNGIDFPLIYSVTTGEMVYANVIGCNTLMASGPKNAIMMLDRGLAWSDLNEDMALMTQVKMLKEKATPKIQAKVSAFEQSAYRSSQKNDFDLARHYLSKAMAILDSSKLGLVYPDLYEPVKAYSLPDDAAKYDALQQGTSSKTVTVTKLKGGYRPAPIVDGKLDNAYLEEGALLDDFRLLDSKLEPLARTKTYIAWDNDNLYVLFNCDEARISDMIIRPNRARDVDTWDSDCAEVLVDKTGNADNMMHFILGAGGEYFDGRQITVEKDGSKSSLSETDQWNPEWKRAVSVDKGSWMAEMAIPMSVLGGAPKNGETWRVNFARERKPVWELSCWSPQTSVFRDPSQFGKIVFKTE